MSLSRLALHLSLLVCMVLAPGGPLGSGDAHAVETEGGAPMHFGGRATNWDRKADTVELVGSAYLRQPNETITADYMHLNKGTRVLRAKGNCIYVTEESVMYGEEMIFNLDSRTGTIYRGRVSNAQFTLGGDEIHKIGDGRFTIKNGEFTTCVDCPSSWAFTGEDIDAQFDGYAFISGATAKVKDAPVAWFPYLILPLKNKRQSGFLFPRIGFSPGNHGFMFMAPFFWAIDRSADMTFGLGMYTLRGPRFEWEGRYRLSERSEAIANLSLVRHTSENNLTAPTEANRIVHRWGLRAKQSQELPFGFEEKLLLNEISDNRYPEDFAGDVPGGGDPVLKSEFHLTRPFKHTGTYLSFRRYRDIRDPNLRAFNGDTVQVLPSVGANFDERPLFGTSILGGLGINATRFTRSGQPFDCDAVSQTAGRCGVTTVTDTSGQATVVPVGNPVFTPGLDPIRESTRFSLVPSISTQYKPADTISIAPTLRYHGFLYQFPSELGVSPLARGYLHFKTDFATQFERIYETSNPDAPRIKHLVRPLVTYSLIPFQNGPEDHPFLEQIEIEARDPNLPTYGYRFDSYDVVPLDPNKNLSVYQLPLGHSLSYGFRTQLIRRNGLMTNPNPGYETFITAAAGQAINFRALRSPATDLFTRFFSTLTYSASLGPERSLSTSATYFYYPGAEEKLGKSPHSFDSSITFGFASRTPYRFAAFSRSVSLRYIRSEIPLAHQLSPSLTYSLWDWLLPSASATYDYTVNRLISFGGGFSIQSRSECWRFDFGASYAWVSSDPALKREDFYKPTFSFNFALNLTGTGFENVSDFAKNVVNQSI